MASATPTKHIPFRRQWNIRRFFARSQWRYQHIPDAAWTLRVSQETILRWLDEHKLC